MGGGGGVASGLTEEQKERLPLGTNCANKH